MDFFDHLLTSELHKYDSHFNIIDHTYQQTTFKQLDNLNKTVSSYLVHKSQWLNGFEASIFNIITWSKIYVQQYVFFFITSGY